MIYPDFLKPGDIIGICAPSAGIGKKKIKDFEKSLQNIKSQGYKVLETSSVRNEGYVNKLLGKYDKTASNSGKARGEEWNNLCNNANVKMILAASGGDMMVEMLDYVKESILLQQPKWVAGYSDPTSLLFHLTTNYDIATIYGQNAGSFAMEKLHPSLQNYFEILKGNLVKQESYEKYESQKRYLLEASQEELNEISLFEEENSDLNEITIFENGELKEKETAEQEKQKMTDGYLLDRFVEWKTPNGAVDITGRIIGGCIDCLRNIIGTQYDGTRKFIEKYKEDGIVWYFDNFALKAEELFFTLWQMKEAGWFQYAKGFVFGRVLFEGTMLEMSYKDAIQRALGKEVPIIMEADIGHVAPKFTLINGAKGHFVSKDGKGSLEMFLE